MGPLGSENRYALGGVRDAVTAYFPNPLGSLVSILVATLFIYFAAKFVLDRTSIFSALLSAVVSTLLAALVLVLVTGTLGIVLSILVWALCTAAFFRTSWLKGAIIGLVAWALSFVVMLLLANLH